VEFGALSHSSGAARTAWPGAGQNRFLEVRGKGVAIAHFSRTQYRQAIDDVKMFFPEQKKAFDSVQSLDTRTSKIVADL